MANILKWTNSNSNTSIISVYRTEVYDPDYQTNFTTPIATIPGNSTSYTDTTALEGVKYYYAMRSERGGTGIWSTLFSIASVLNRGPGPNVLLYGDERLGYFGTVSPVELPSLLDSISTDNSQVAVFRMKWHKFIRKGKILYVSGWGAKTNPFKVSTIMQTYGIDNGIDWGVSVPTWPTSGKQTKVFLNGHTYYPRLPRSCPDDWRPDLPNAFNFADFISDPTTEFNEVIMPTFADTYYPHPFGSVVTYDPALIGNSTYGFACAERGSLSNESNVVHRVSGAWANTTYVVAVRCADTFRVGWNTLSGEQVSLILELFEG